MKNVTSEAKKIAERLAQVADDLQLANKKLDRMKSEQTKATQD